MGTLEGYCYFHVQAIMLAIDQYAETALGNREYFVRLPARRPNPVNESLRQMSVAQLLRRSTTWIFERTSKAFKT
jgi:hypothetical protein